MTATTSSVSPARCAGVWLGATAVAMGLVAWLLRVLTAARTASVVPAPRFDDLLVAACAAAALLATAWLWTLTTLVVAEVLRGGGPAPGVPAVVRRLVLSACGAAIVAGLAAPVHATPGDLHVDRDRPAATAATAAGLPYPDRAVGHPRTAPVPREVAVRPGDSLWRIADRELGSGARWTELYALNRDVVGADPDLIRPAQRLRLPIQ